MIILIPILVSLYPLIFALLSLESPSVFPAQLPAATWRHLCADYSNYRQHCITGGSINSIHILESFTVNINGGHKKNTSQIVIHFAVLEAPIFKRKAKRFLKSPGHSDPKFAFAFIPGFDITKDIKIKFSDRNILK